MSRSLFPILALLMSVILFFTIVDPLYGDISQLKDDIATYNLALDNSKSLQKTQDALVTAYKNIKQEDKDRLMHFLPSTVNNIEFILEIEQVANLYNIPIEDIRFESSKKDQAPQPKAGVLVTNDPVSSRPYGVFSVEFSTEGDYNTFVSFLKDVERNLRLVDVRHIDFTVPPPSNAKDGPDPSILKYNMKVETYWLK